MKIRPAQIEDAAAIAGVHLASWKTTYPGIIPQAYIDGLNVENGIAMWREQLAQATNPVFVGIDDESIFGFAAGGAIIHPVEGFEAEIASIYLLESHQRLGAGRALLAHLAHTLHQRGFQNCVVWALEANPACGFYQRLGGEPVAKQSIEIGGASLPELAFGWPDIRTLCELEPSTRGDH